jgi:hypothetical protein
MEEGGRLRCWRKIPKKMLEKKCWEKMLEQFSTALPTISTFHKNVEKILKKRKILSNIFKNVDKK